MALKKEHKDGHTYFELHISCPVCHDKGLFTKQSFWSHYGCGGSLYLGDDANYWCDTCGKKSHVREWKYGCPTHSNGQEYEFVSSSAAGLAAALSTAGQMVTETGVQWLQIFLTNMGEF